MPESNPFLQVRQSNRGLNPLVFWDRIGLTHVIQRDTVLYPRETADSGMQRLERTDPELLG